MCKEIEIEEMLLINGGCQKTIPNNFSGSIAEIRKILLEMRKRLYKEYGDLHIDLSLN